MMIQTETDLRSQSDRSVAPGADASAPEQTVAKEKHASGLLAIAIFKLCKAFFFFALGLGALRLIHVNLGDLTLRAASVLHFDPEGKLFSMIQDKMDLVSGHQLRQVSSLSVGYSLVSLTEGIGLLMEKTWAEYLTLILTTCALPWEIVEIVKRPTGMRVGLLVINLAVLAYLLWFVRGQHRAKLVQASSAA